MAFQEVQCKCILVEQALAFFRLVPETHGCYRHLLLMLAQRSAWKRSSNALLQLRMELSLIDQLWSGSGCYGGGVVILVALLCW
ncbi:hypothetical protein Tco_0287083 [Tanacetum coccineum]